MSHLANRHLLKALFQSDVLGTSGRIQPKYRSNFSIKGGESRSHRQCCGAEQRCGCESAAEKKEASPEDKEQAQKQGKAEDRRVAVSSQEEEPQESGARLQKRKSSRCEEQQELAQDPNS